MDLNTEDYSTKELMAALGISTPGNSITLMHLQNCLNDKLEVIMQADVSSLQDSKRDLTLFFHNAFFRIMSELELNQTHKFISVEEGLLPPLVPTAPVQQGGSVVAQHVNHAPVETFPSHVAAGIVNPLTRKSYKKLLNINTKFRRDYQTTRSTDFQIELPYPIKKVVSMKLQNSEFPKTVYTFAKSLGSNYFQIDGSGSTGWELIEIPDGSYPSLALAQVVTAALAMKGYAVTLNIDLNNGKSTFKGPHEFGLNFNYIADRCPIVPSNIDRNQLTLGWLLGFRGDAIKTPEATLQYQKPRKDWIQWSSKCCAPPYDYDARDPSSVYDASHAHVSEGVFSGHGTPYFLLLVDDYNNNHSDVIISPFKDQSLVDNSVIAKISTECCVGGCGCGPERIYFGPVEVRRLRIRLLDEYGREVEINNADYSITLELELIYDL